MQVLVQFLKTGGGGTTYFVSCLHQLDLSAIQGSVCLIGRLLIDRLAGRWGWEVVGSISVAHTCAADMSLPPEQKQIFLSSSSGSSCISILIKPLFWSTGPGASTTACFGFGEHRSQRRTALLAHMHTYIQPSR